MSVINHRVDAHKAVLIGQLSYYSRMLDNWDRKKGTNKTWLINLIDSLTFVIFLLEELEEDQKKLDTYGYSYFKKSDDGEDEWS